MKTYETKDVKRKLAARLRSNQSFSQLEQKDLAKICGVSQYIMCRVLKGKSEIKIALLVKILNALQLDFNDLL